MRSDATSPPVTSLATSVSSRWAYVITAVLLIGIVAGSPNFRPTSHPQASPFAGDFLQEWIAGHMLRQGDHAKFYDPEYAKHWEHRTEIVGLEWSHDEYFPMVYPPFYYAWVLPLSYLSFTTAAYVWLSILLLAYFAAWRIFVCLPGSSNNPPHAFLLPLSLLFVPLIENITSCQKGTLLLLVLTATYALLTRGRPFSAGLVFGLMAFKPQFALPLAVVMLCKQQWRFVLGGLTTGTLLAGVCWLMSQDLCTQYIAFSRHATDYMQNGGYDLTKSHALYGSLTLLLGQGSITPLVQAVTGVAALLTLGMVALVWRGPLCFHHARFQSQFAVLIIATILLSPHVYTYDLTMLLLPMGLLAREAFASHAVQPASWRPAQAFGWIAITLFVSAGFSPRLASFSGVQITVPLMLLFLLTAVWEQLQQPVGQSNPLLTDYCFNDKRHPNWQAFH
jgi:hypothetical protein